MKIGSLYQTHELYFLLYPSMETAVTAAESGASYRVAVEAEEGEMPYAIAGAVAASLSKRLKCAVKYIAPNSIFCCLEQKDEFIKILTTNGELGWICNFGWCMDYIEEVIQ
jgi:hypothetical protein